MPSFEGNLLTQRHRNYLVGKWRLWLSHGEDPESLSDLGLVRPRIVTPQTDRQTDRIAISNTRYSSIAYLPVQLWRVKINRLIVFGEM